MKSQENSPKEIRYIVGSKKALSELGGKFDYITSIMVFQFIENLEAYASLFFKRLKPKGKIVFAVVNPRFVERCAQKHVHFFDVRPPVSPKRAIFKLREGVEIPVFIRTEEEYKQLFEKTGFEFIEAAYPPFTEEFVKAYRWKLPYDVPEFLIMAFRKKD